MKSIIKRLRKIRSNGRKTQHRHSSLRWSSKQNKSRKNIMMGGTPSSSSRRSPSDTRPSNGWNCKCNKVSDEHNALPEQESLSSNVEQQQSRPQTKPSPESIGRKVRRFMRRDTTGYTGLDDIINFTAEGVEFKSDPSTISGGNLTKYDIITHVNNSRISPGLDEGVAKSNWEEHTYGPVGKVVTLTVNMPNLEGGYPLKYSTKKVKITLIPRLPSGGRKTTYRRKKDVSSSRRKMNSESHNKKRKVMVGGKLDAVFWEYWNNLDLDAKIKFIKTPNQPFTVADLTEINSYISHYMPREKSRILSAIGERLREIYYAQNPAVDGGILAGALDADKVDGQHPVAAAFAPPLLADYRHSQPMKTSKYKDKSANKSSGKPVSQKQNVMCECTKNRQAPERNIYQIDYRDKGIPF